MKLIKASDAQVENPTLKLLTYGFTGSGKTTWAAKSPMPLFIATEPQALPSIQAANPSAMVVLVEDWEDFKMVWEDLVKATAVKLPSGQSAARVYFSKIKATVDFQTLVLDSLTDLQQRMIESMTGAEKSVAKALMLNAGPQMSLPQWGQLQNAMARILRDQRAIPCNVIVVCLASENYDEKSRRRVLPLLSGKQVIGSIGQYFNGVAYQTMDKEDRHVCCWMPSSRFISKPAPGFPGVTLANVTLGSLLLSTYPDSASVAKSPSDSKDAVVDSRSVESPQTATANTTNEGW